MSRSTIALLVLLVSAASASSSVSFKNTCIDDAPTVPEGVPGCGVLTTVDQAVFGDNANSKGTLYATPKRGGMHIGIRLKNLSKRNLVLTAWLVYAFPSDPDKLKIFNYGYGAAPLAATNAAFTSGLGREPNQFRYTSRSTARLDVRLNFNPFFEHEGPLAMATFCNQKDIPGIQTSQFRQPTVAVTAVDYPFQPFVPIGSSFLRKFDPATGFEKLDRMGKPELVRSPLPAFAVVVAVHIDKTTHGISPGLFGADHFELMSFRLTKRVGRRAVS